MRALSQAWTKGLLTSWSVGRQTAPLTILLSVAVLICVGCGPRTGFRSPDGSVEFLLEEEGRRLFDALPGTGRTLVGESYFPGGKGLGPDGGTPIRHQRPAGSETRYGVYVRDPDPAVFLLLDPGTNVIRTVPIGITSLYNHDFVSTSESTHWLLTQGPRRDGRRADRSLYAILWDGEAAVASRVAGDVFYRAFVLMTEPGNAFFIVPTGRRWAGINREQPVTVTLYHLEPGPEESVDAIDPEAPVGRGATELRKLALWKGAAGWQPELRISEDQRMAVLRMQGGRRPLYLKIALRN